MLSFTPLSPEFRADPYRYYDELRTVAPVYFLESMNSWLLSSYDDCAKALKDPRLGREVAQALSPEAVTQRESLYPPEAKPAFAMMRNWMLQRDPPVHTRLRMLVHKAFTPRTVERLKLAIERLASELLDAVQEQGKMDLVEALAFPLPVIVIAELIGVPAADRDKFRGWSNAVIGILDGTRDPETWRRGGNATVEFTAFLRNMITRRRKDPGEDLLTALIAVEEAGEMLTEAELIDSLILLLAAGHETTVKLLANGTYDLLRHPDQLAQLRADPSLLRNAIEEMIRYDCPVHLLGRWILEDFELHGSQLRRGQGLTVMIGAANRDPKQFPDPDTFDIDRVGADKHIGFGNGIHFCLGAPLARLEASIVFPMLLNRFPNLTLAEEPPRYAPTLALHGLESLPVCF